MVNNDGRKDIFVNLAIFTRRLRLPLVLNFLFLIAYLHLRTLQLRFLFIFVFIFFTNGFCSFDIQKYIFASSLLFVIYAFLNCAVLSNPFLF